MPRGSLILPVSFCARACTADPSFCLRSLRELATIASCREPLFPPALVFGLFPRRVRQIAQSGLRLCVQRLNPLFQIAQQRCARIGFPQKQFIRPLPQSRWPNGERIACVFFKDDMEIGSAKSERAYARAAWMTAGARQPRAGLGIDEERSFWKTRSRVRLLNSRAWEAGLYGEGPVRPSLNPRRQPSTWCGRSWTSPNRWRIPAATPRPPRKHR